MTNSGETDGEQWWKYAYERGELKVWDIQRQAPGYKALLQTVATCWSEELADAIIAEHNDRHASTAALAEAQAKAKLADEMAAALDGLGVDGETLLVFRPLDESKFWHAWCDKYAALTRQPTTGGA